MKQEPRYTVEFRFDIAKAPSQSRVTWLHKLSDENVASAFNQQQSYTQNETQMAPGDIIQFTLCLFNMNGIVDLDSLEWEKPAMISIPDNEQDALHYYSKKIVRSKIKGHFGQQNKVLCNTNRICEIEDAVVEWIKISKINQPLLPIRVPNNILSKFVVDAIYFNECD